VVLARPPRSLRLVFNERVQLAGRGVRVLGPTGRRVEQGPTRVSGDEVRVGVDATAPGTYRVLWRVVAADTHPAQGTFVFSVGHPTGPPANLAAGAVGPGRSAVGLMLQAIARAIHFVGYALSFGVFAFRRLVLVPRSLTVDASIEGRVWRLIEAGILGLLVAEPLALLAQAVSLSVPPESPFDLEVVGGALDSSFGLVLAQRVGAAALLWVLVGAVRNAAVREAVAAWAVLGLGVAVALIDGEAAHAVGARPAWLGFGANVLHESAMGWWIGAVLGLLGIWRLPAVVSHRGEVAAATARFAGPSVAVLVLSGTVMAVQHLAGPGDLVATAYGRTLAAKLCVLGAGMALAWAAVTAPVERRSRWWTREAAVLLSLLALAGLLVSMPPPI
jgi:copper transport protein